jgi:hypothetical protein
MMRLRSSACVFATLAVLVFGRSPAFAQGEPPVKITPASSAQDDHERMERLIGEVELRLRKIDALLSDAGAGDRSALAKVGPSGLEGLLKRSQDDVHQVVTDIDRILELADHVHSGGT